jgi:hypothetical protein
VSDKRKVPILHFNVRSKSLGDTKPRIIYMQNIFHMDEKSIHMTAKEIQLLVIHNKNSIGKVMFLTVVTRLIRNAQ